MMRVKVVLQLHIRLFLVSTKSVEIGGISSQYKPIDHHRNDDTKYLAQCVSLLYRVKRIKDPE